MRRTGGGCLGCLGLILFCLSLSLAAEGPAPSGEGTYVVKKGDTLWGIAKTLLNDPFLWPRLWEQNPFIADPNRIYPGDTLVLPGQQVTAAPPPPAPAVVEAPKPEPPKEPPKEEEKAAPPAPAAKAEIGVTALPPVPPASPQAIACSPVLMEETAAATAGIGNIARSDEDRLLLSQEDRIFVGLAGAHTAKVGDRLAVIRMGPRVIHPETKKSLGRVLFTLGVLEATDVQQSTIRARVIYACEDIRNGDRVAPFTLAPFPAEKIAKPSTRKVEGTILDSPRLVQLAALQFLVFLDVGLAQGIGPGDVFAIYRPRPPTVNPATGQALSMAPEPLGEAVVIRVMENTATAVLTVTAKEVQIGDRVVLSRQVEP